MSTPTPDATPGDDVDLDATTTPGTAEGPEHDDHDDQDAPAAPDFDPAALLAKVRKANREARALRERATAAEAKAQAAPDLERRASDAEARAMRAEVALELGLPAALAKRLTGSTPEELKADAEELLALMPAATPASLRPAPRSPAPVVHVEPEDVSAVGARIFGRR